MVLKFVLFGIRIHFRLQLAPTNCNIRVGGTREVFAIKVIVALMILCSLFLQLSRVDEYTLPLSYALGICNAWMRSSPHAHRILDATYR